MARPSKIEYRQPSVRSVATWDPPAVRTALSSLMSGSFWQAAVLFDAILGDDRAQAVIGTRVQGILGLPIKFEPADETDRAQEIATLLEADFWDIAPEDALDELLTYGRGLGACAAALVWERHSTNSKKAGRWIPKLEVWHPSLMRYDAHRDMYFVQTLQGEVEVTDGDGKWLLYTPYGRRRPWTKALVRSLAIPWLSKMFSITDWNRYSEIYGSPIRKGTSPEGAAEDEKEAFRRELATLGHDSTILTPAGWDVGLVEATSRGGDTFEKLIAWADTAMAVAVLGQNLTTEVSGGSFAAAKVHGAVKQDLIESDTEGLSTVTHQQAIRWWSEFNFGDRALAPWPAWETDPPPDEGKIEEFHLKAPLIKRNQLLAKLGLPALSEEEGGNEFVVIAEPGADPTQLLGARSPQKVAGLASGDDPATAPGFLNGQLYVDALADRGRQRSAEALREDLDKVLAVLQGGSDYPSLRAGLMKLYPTLDPEGLSRVMEQALVLADLAGRLAETEDGRG
jgi:phage gp29-like protein